MSLSDYVKFRHGLDLSATAVPVPYLYNNREKHNLEATEMHKVTKRLAYTGAAIPTPQVAKLVEFHNVCLAA